MESIHDTINEKAAKCSHSELQRVLFWPESVHPSITPSFVLGWKQTIGCCEQVIVAGIIEVDAEMNYEEQLTLLRDRVYKLFPCHCCSCESDETEHCCAGCTRRLLTGIDVVAFYATSGSEMVDCSLPVISSDKGFPFWTEDCGYSGSQLIYFQDVGRDKAFPMFQLGYGAAESDSFRLFLRMEYASCVMSKLRKSSRGDKETQVPLLPCTSDKHWSLAWRPRFLTHHSLLFRHLAKHGLNLPIVQIARSLNSLKDNPRPEQSTACCEICNQPTAVPVTHRQLARRRIEQRDSTLRCAVDIVVGALLGHLLASLFSDERVLLERMHSYFEMLRRAMDWLNSFPIGFKLNEQLTAVLSHQVCLWLVLHETLVDRFLSGLLRVFAPNVVQIAGVFCGGTMLLALLFDALQIGSFHIFCLAMLFGRIYQAELSLVHALWSLFRGKKRNILRHRTDTMEYDSTQLLFGTILFVIALFLFTTILVYQLFFSASYLVVALCLAAIQLSFVVLQKFPFGKLAQRAISDWFLVKVYLEHDETLSSEAIDVTYLRSSRCALSVMVWNSLAAPLLSTAHYLLGSTLCIATGSPQEPNKLLLGL